VHSFILYFQTLNPSMLILRHSGLKSAKLVPPGLGVISRFFVSGFDKTQSGDQNMFSQYVLILGGVRRQQTHAARNPSPPTPFPTLMTPNRSTTLSSVIAVTRRCGVEIVALLSSHGRRRAPLSAVETRTLRPTSYVHIDPVWMAGPPVQCCKKVPACARWE
jgi:hypothetical protein